MISQNIAWNIYNAVIVILGKYQSVTVDFNIQSRFCNTVVSLLNKMRWSSAASDLTENAIHFDAPLDS
jgi:hypothetical protein